MTGEPTTPTVPTTPGEAREVLDRLGFVRGKSSTRGLPPAERDLVKAACRLLAHSTRKEA